MKLHTRKFSIPKSGPATLDAEARTVEIVIATDTDEVTRMDWDTGRQVPEILVMSGCSMPQTGQVPLLDSHDRYSVASVLGSVKQIRTEGGTMIGVAEYSDTDSAAAAFRLLQQGHLTDYSVGFRIENEVRLDADQERAIDGITYAGPAVLITQWAIKEVSACPIGADSHAKARSEHHTHTTPQTEESMGNTIPTAAESRAEKPAEAPPVVDTDGIRTASTTAERDRIREIMAMCRTHGCEDLADAMIDSGTGIDAARAQVLDHLASAAQTDPAPAYRTEVIADENDKFRAAAQDALCLRGGLAVENPAEGATELRGYTLREMARECLRREGVRKLPSNPVEMVGRALTSSDFPILLGNVANISLEQGWAEAAETWEQWCDIGNLPDFKIHSFAQAGAFSSLDEIPEAGEYEYGDLGEAKEQIKIAKFGKLFAISREAIINDDMNVITDVPRKMGEAAAATVGDQPWAVLTANSAMGDGKALFHSGHSNLGTGGALSVTTLNEAFQKMATQKGLDGRRGLNIRPQFALLPYAIMGTSEEFFKSDRIDNISGNTRQTNIYAGSVLTRIYESRLDDVSQTAWFLAAARGRTVRVYFLNGNRTPYMETRNGFSRDGVEYKVRIEAAAAPRDFRGLFKNAGA